MEILLLSDIPGIGKKNDLLIVGDGYALNYLLPARKALVVTPNVRRRYAEKIKERALERESERTQLTEAAKFLRGKKITLAAAASASGRLYAGLPAAAIAKAIRDQLGTNVDESAIALPSPIKEAGTHTVSIASGSGTTPLIVEVTAQAAKKK